MNLTTIFNGTAIIFNDTFRLTVNKTADAKRVATFALIGFLMLAAHTTSANAQTPTVQRSEATTPQAKRDSVVRGRVVYEDTNRPLRRVSVNIFDPSNRASYRMGWTDGRGEFVFKNMPAGTYHISVRAPGIIPLRVDAAGRGEGSDYAPTTTVDGTNSTNVRVGVRRGAAITGLVKYADGDPAVNAQIIILRRDGEKVVPVPTQQQDYGDGRMLTDDRGWFRISGLAPGEYLIAAAEQKTNVEPLREDEGEGGSRIYRAMVGLTYYPNVVAVKDATSVRVAAGEEAKDIDIRFVERAAYMISGTVRMRGTNLPVARAQVSIKLKDEANAAARFYGENNTVLTDEQGAWAIDEIENGAYTVTVEPTEDYRYRGAAVATEAEDKRKPGFTVKRQDLTVAGGDMAGIAIEISRGARIFGTVTMEGGKPLPRELYVSAELAQTRAEANNGGGRMMMTARVRANGTFTLEGVPADGVNLAAGGAYQREMFYVKSIADANGADLQSEPVRVGDDDELRGVRIVLSTSMANLTGRVLTATGGAGLSGAQVYFVPAATAANIIADKPRGSRRDLFALTSGDGSFKVEGAPGEYVLVVMRAGETLDKTTRKARLAAAQRVTLKPGENKSIEIVAPPDK